MFLVLFCFISVDISEIQLVCDRPTDGRTDGPTDGRTDIPSYRDARTHLKTCIREQSAGSPVKATDDDEIAGQSFFLDMSVHPYVRPYVRMSVHYHISETTEIRRNECCMVENHCGHVLIHYGRPGLFL